MRLPLGNHIWKGTIKPKLPQYNLNFGICYAKVRDLALKILDLLGLLRKLRCLIIDERKRAFKNGHARVETRVLKTLACRNGFRTSFKQW